MVERVGKKYQWISFNEVLGAITDHHDVNPWGDGEPQPYEYAEQLVWRDIDPTVLVRKPAARQEPVRPWFSPAKAAFPPGIAREYPAGMAGVPDPLDLIAVTDPQGVPHLVLTSHPDWQQPLAPEIEAQRVPQLTVWLQIRGYLVPVSEAQALCEWARFKDWEGRWMPEGAEPHNVLLGAHPDDPEWAAAEGSIERWDDHRSGGPQPAELLQCAAWYGGTGTSRDASAQQETTGYVPSRRLFDVLRLSRGVDFTCHDAAGVAVHDPSVVLGGPGTLAMRRDLASRLADAELTIFWTVLIGNELQPAALMPPGRDYRWVSASASYILNANRVEQVSVTVLRYIVVDECGTVLNPMIVEGQQHGGVAHGIGNALLEEACYDESGQFTTATFLDYLLPGAAEVPDIQVLHQSFPSPLNPLGVKGTGEGGATSSPAAVVNAVADAVRPLRPELTDLPLSPVRLFTALREARGAETVRGPTRSDKER